MSDDFSPKWERVLKKQGGDFIDSSESKSTDELQKQILKSQTVISDLEKDMENDVKLNSLKEDVKVLAGAYRDEMKLEQAKTMYCLWLLKNRGQDTGS